jgi:hypothetical protein
MIDLKPSNSKTTTADVQSLASWHWFRN